MRGRKTGRKVNESKNGKIFFKGKGRRKLKGIKKGYMTEKNDMKKVNEETE